MKNVMLALSLATVAGSAHAVLPDISATPCNGCSEQQFEAKAISLGVGTKYLYDFTGRTFRHYQVSREPKPGGGFLFEAIDIGADPVYLAYFNDSLSYRDQYGAFSIAAEQVPMGLTGPRNPESRQAA